MDLLKNCNEPIENLEEWNEYREGPTTSRILIPVKDEFLRENYLSLSRHQLNCYLGKQDISKETIELIYFDPKSNMDPNHFLANNNCLLSDDFLRFLVNHYKKSNKTWYIETIFNRGLPDNLLEEFKDSISPDYLLLSEIASGKNQEEIIYKYLKRFSYVSKLRTLKNIPNFIYSDGFVEEFKEFVLHRSVVKLTEEQAKKYQYEFDWDDLWIEGEVSSSFLEEFENDLNWFNLTNTAKLTEEQLERFSHKLNFEVVGLAQDLKESYIIRNQHLLKMDDIIVTQNLSDDLFKCHFHNGVLFNYYTLSEKELSPLKLNLLLESPSIEQFEVLQATQPLTMDDLSKYINHLNLPILRRNLRSDLSKKELQSLTQMKRTRSIYL